MSVEEFTPKKRFSEKFLRGLVVGLAVLFVYQIASAGTEEGVPRVVTSDCASYQELVDDKGKYYLVSVNESCGADYFIVRLYAFDESEIIIPKETGEKIRGKSKRITYKEGVLYIRVTRFVNGLPKEHAFRVPEDSLSAHL